MKSNIRRLAILRWMAMGVMMVGAVISGAGCTNNANKPTAPVSNNGKDATKSQSELNADEELVKQQIDINNALAELYEKSPRPDKEAVNAERKKNG